MFAASKGHKNYISQLRTAASVELLEIDRHSEA